jgi:predicted outer membrane lipoprotein
MLGIPLAATIFAVLTAIGFSLSCMALVIEIASKLQISYLEGSIARISGRLRDSHADVV